MQSSVSPIDCFGTRYPRASPNPFCHGINAIAENAELGMSSRGR